MASATPSPFLLLPVEIRLMIYDHLFVPIAKIQDAPNPTLQMRLIDPTEQPSQWAKQVLPTLQRTKCHIHTGRFRGRTMQTTYTTINNPGIHANVLATCKKVHNEGIELLYGSYIFDFGTDIEAIPPFLSDLTEEATCYIKRVGLVKRALPYDRDFDCAEWAFATHSIATNLPELRCLDLGVMAGRPGPDGWNDVPEWTRDDFESWTKRTWRELEWVRDVARIHPKELNVRAIVEHCPPTQSEMMSFWVGVSKSVVDGGFGEWVSGLMGCNEVRKLQEFRLLQ